MNGCLSESQIDQFLAGRLALEPRNLAKNHLDGCEKCRQQLEARRVEDGLFQNLQAAFNGTDRHSCGATPSAGVAPESAYPACRTSIEGYEILGAGNHGGQGVVYKALHRATKRTVALKVLLEGRHASLPHRQRFEREIELIAAVQHPNIVTVYDSGVTQEGLHFYAMEYIHGQPLDAPSCAEHLGIDAILGLFQQIAGAINHLHLRGIIHRDLKPDNIQIDATGVPHIVDFGLARTAGTHLMTDGRPVTDSGVFVGTLAYTSPEQALGDPRLIDTRSDVYALGMILYEMLTGVRPYPVTGRLADDLANIAKCEPKRPSALRHDLNDELDTIVLKALAKSKEARYQSVDALSRDVDHYLRGEPIDAKRDSAWYVLRKALRQYKTAARVLAAFVLLAGGFAIWLISLHSRAVKAEQDAITSLDTVLRLPGLLLERGDTAGAVALLREALDSERRRVNGDHVNIGSLLINLGKLLYEQGDFAGAESALLEAQAMTARLGGDLANIQVSLGLVLGDKGDLDEAEALLRRAISSLRAAPGCEPWFIGNAQSHLGNVLMKKGRYAEAETEMLEAHHILTAGLGATNQRTTKVVRRLASLYELWNKPEKANEYHALVPGDPASANSSPTRKNP